MPEFTAEEETAWRIVMGDNAIPGSPEPLPGKCGAALHPKDLRVTLATFLNRPFSEITKRYCKMDAGAGTKHIGYGTCFLHFGNAPNHEKRNMALMMHDEFTTLAERWQEPVGLDPAPVEAERLFLKMKKMSLVLEQEVLRLQQWDATTLQGQNHVKAIVELFERALDRYADFIKFAMKFELSAKRLELEEAQGQDIAGAVMRVVLDATLQLEDWQLDKIRENLERELLVLSPRLRPSWAQDFDEDVIDAEEVDS